MEINDQHRPGKSSNSAFRNSDRPMLFIILHPKSGVILIEIYDLYLVLTPLEIKQAMKIKKISSLNIETQNTPMNTHFPDLLPGTGTLFEILRIKDRL